MLRATRLRAALAMEIVQISSGLPPEKWHENELHSVTERRQTDAGESVQRRTSSGSCASMRRERRRRSCAGGTGSRRRPSTSMDGSPVARRFWFWPDANRLQTSIRRRQVDGAPKWDIRSHPPRQVVGLEGHYKSQGLSVPVRSVSPFTDPSSNPCSSFTQRSGTARHWSARPRLPVRSC